MHRNRHLAMRLRHVMRIDGGDPAGGSGADPKAEPKADPKGGEPDAAGKTAERLAELEARLADWEQVKAKADKWDAHEASVGKDDNEAFDRLNERLAAIEKERDELKAEQARRDLVDKVAKATGLDATAVAMLNGDDEKTLTDAAKAMLALMDDKTKTTKPRGPKPPRTDPLGADEAMTPMDRMRAAYAN